MTTKILIASAFAFTLTACGGGGSGGSTNDDTSSGFTVPSASGGDGLDKVISLLNIQDETQVHHSVGGSLSSNRGELIRGVGCSSSTSRNRNEFNQASSITNNQVCVGTECATAKNNSLLVTDAATPDVRSDTIFFFGGTVEMTSNATLFEVEAGREQICDSEGPAPDSQFPTAIEGEYKGFIYRRNGEQLDRSEVLTLDCTANECEVSGDVVVDSNITLKPEGGEPGFIWEGLSIKFAPGEAQKRFNAIFSASPGGDVLGGVGIPIDGSPICSRDCVTLALQRQ
jgi:hypothetical protein